MQQLHGIWRSDLPSETGDLAEVWQFDPAGTFRFAVLASQQLGVETAVHGYYDLCERRLSLLVVDDGIDLVEFSRGNHVWTLTVDVIGDWLQVDYGHEVQHYSRLQVRESSTGRAWDGDERLRDNADPYRAERPSESGMHTAM